MNKRIKFIISFLSLFLTFIALTRILEYRYKYSLLSFKISFLKKSNLKENRCVPRDNSIINYLNKEKLKTLIVVLDGFPSYKTVNSYYKNGSNFHNFMKSKNYFYFSGKSIINSSSISLAYLLNFIIIILI